MLLLGSTDKWWFEERWSRSVEEVRGLVEIRLDQGKLPEQGRQLGKEVGYLAISLHAKTQPAERRLRGRQGTAAEEDSWVGPFLYMPADNA